MSAQLKTSLDGSEITHGIAKDDGTFMWDHKEQKWYHSACDQFSEDEEGYCLCNARNPRVMVWNDIAQFANIAAPDADYLSFFNYVDIEGKELPGDLSARDHIKRRLMKAAVWAKGTMEVVTYWHPGSCEGYYVQIDAIKCSPMASRAESSRVGVGTIKVFSANEAATIADKITRFIYINR